MNWIFATYLLALVYLTTHKDKLARGNSLRGAWTWLALIPIVQFVFALMRAGNFRNPRDLALVEIWADGFGWLFLGISMLRLIGVINQCQTGNAEGGRGGSDSPSN